MSVFWASKSEGSPNHGDAGAGGKERRPPKAKDRRQSQKISIQATEQGDQSIPSHSCYIKSCKLPRTMSAAVLTAVIAWQNRTGQWLPSGPTSKAHTAAHPGTLHREALVGEDEGVSHCMSSLYWVR